MKRLVLLLVLLVLAFYVGWPAWSGWQLGQALQSKDVATVGRKIDFPSVRRGLEPVVAREVAVGVDRYLQDLGPVANVFGPALKQQYLPKISAFTLDTLVTPENLVRLVTEAGSFQEIAERILVEALDKPGSGLGGGRGTGGGGGGGGGGMKLPGGLGGLVGDLGRGAGGIPGLGDGGGMPDVKDVLKALVAEARKSRGAPQAPAAKPAAPDAKGGGFGLANVKRFGFLGPFAMEVGVAKEAAQTKPDVVAEMSFSGGDWRLTKLVPGL